MSRATSPMLRRGAGLLAGCALGCLAAAATDAAHTAASAPPGPSARDGQHDFDFDIGRWRTDSSRLLHPLSGSQDWIEMHGTTVVHRIWDGRANLAEFESDGPTGHLELLSLRLYDPQAQQWNLNFATSAVGTRSAAMIGRFRDGRGEFYDQESIGGRSVLVRFSMWSIAPGRAQSEQAFSGDGGRAWEVNWINRYTRLQE